MASATARVYRTTRARLLHTSPSSPSLPLPTIIIVHDDLIVNSFIYFLHPFPFRFARSNEYPRVLIGRVCASESADCLLNHAKKEKNVFFEFFSSFSSLFTIYYAFSIFTVIFFCCARASHKTRITDCEWKINAGQSYRFILLQRMNSAAGIKLQEFALFLVLIKTGGLFYSVSRISQLTHISVGEVAAAL